MNFKNLLSAILLLFIGCSHQVTIRPNLNVTASIANQLDYNVGIYISPEMKNMQMSDQANWSNKYIFDVGNAISSIIHKSFMQVFKNVELFETYPTEQMLKQRKIDFIVTPRITEANVSLNVKEGFFRNDAQGNCQITVTLPFLEQNLIQFTTVNATGTGIGDESIDPFSTGKDEFVVSVENTIRNLGNIIVQQVYGNYDIRKKTEQK